jgi:hypothetical protein
MKKTKNLHVAYLARKVGAKENASVMWTSFGCLYLQWVPPSGDPIRGCVSPRLARLLAKRINQALDEA